MTLRSNAFRGRRALPRHVRGLLLIELLAVIVLISVLAPAQGNVGTGPPGGGQAGAATPPALSSVRIQGRIRRYRMADLTVSVRDARGNPAPGLRVEVTQTSHAFLFGCNTLPLQPDNHEAWQRAYQERFAALFNFAAVGVFWNGFEPSPGEPRYAFVDSQVAWLQAHGIACEGTPLVWHESYPDWAPTDPDATIPLLHRHVTALITHYRPGIHCWVVTNEALSAPAFHDGEANWIRRDGPVAVVAATLRWARAAGRGVPETFLYNDYNTGHEYVMLLTRLAAGGQMADAIGIQAHMHQGTLSMDQLWQVCRRFSRFGRPLYFTESTVLSGPTRRQDQINYTGPPATDWLTTPAGEAAQADYVTQFYTLLFSAPAVRAINWWDLSDRGAWLGAPAGLLRMDMTPKPAYTALMTLIHKTWWTRGQGRTNATGRYRLHAFYGDYEIIVRDGRGRTRTKLLVWPEGSGPRTVTVSLSQKAPVSSETNRKHEPGKIFYQLGSAALTPHFHVLPRR